ncbi:MAG: phenylalanine--tRNA ligase beta subunit-related protein, partial [bacterium]|nr:phenylalanine--tRNA ligase beta subunit-related protein [bacterium]
MRYSLKILKEYAKGSFTDRDIQNWLSMLGLNPVIYKQGDDVFFEIEAPANRGDLLSAIGILKAIAPFGQVELLYPNKEIREEIENSISIEIESLEDCAFYAARIIEGVGVSPSPLWLKEKVIAAGFRSINNVVDITNLVLWEFGHPLHAFDLDLIKDRIIVRRAMNGEEITTIDGEKRTLSSDVLVIADVEKPIAIAGVMGGLNT